MNKGNRRALTYLLIAADPGAGRTGVDGITRLQKMLYLLEKSYNIKQYMETDYDFKPYRFGPYSKELYDDIEFLENLDLIKSTDSGEFELAQKEEEEAIYTEVDLSTQDMIEGDYQEHHFVLTENGKRKLESIKTKLKKNGVPIDEVLGAINEVKAKYGAMPLAQLIHYVYRKYPESAVNSELRHLL